MFTILVSTVEAEVEANHYHNNLKMYPLLFLRDVVSEMREHFKRWKTSQNEREFMRIST